MFLSLQVFAFERQNMAFIVNVLLTCIQKNCDAGLVCDLNCLQVPGGVSHMKQTGMLVVSLRGVSFGFWSRLGCSGQSTNILGRHGLA